MSFKKAVVFEYRDYKQFLKDLSDLKPRGFKSALAQAASCQLAYVTHVLGGAAHFSLEQAEGISRFLGHTKLEQRYFLTLVEFARAGTPQLRHALAEFLQDYREKFFSLKERVNIKQSLSSEDQLIYYSSWVYAAVHVMTSIPALQSREALASALVLPLAKVNEVCDFLIQTKLIGEDGKRLTMTSRQIHLGKDSPLISQHHSNWRIQAIRSLDLGKMNDIHYSSVFTLSEEGAERVRAILTQAIADSVQIIKGAKEEQTRAMTIDFFSVN